MFRKPFNRQKGEVRICNQCGVEFETFKPIWKCNDCIKKNAKEGELRKKAKLNNVSKRAIAVPFKHGNRTAHWNKIAKELKTITDRDEIREYISKKADEVFNNKELMEYINHQNITEVYDSN